MEWTDEIIAKLTSLWSEGLSTAEIGRRLNISKNAVVGKAHRLNLPPRPSPIRRQEGVPAAPRAVRHNWTKEEPIAEPEVPAADSSAASNSRCWGTERDRAPPFHDSTGSQPRAPPVARLAHPWPPGP